MPPTLSKPSSAAPTSLFYITVGALMTVWSGIWYACLHNAGSSSIAMNYVCIGCLVSGLVLLFIGFSLGPIARWARHAELPPGEVTPAAVQSEQKGVTTRSV